MALHAGSGETLRSKEDLPTKSAGGCHGQEETICLDACLLARIFGKVRTAGEPDLHELAELRERDGADRHADDTEQAEGAPPACRSLLRCLVFEPHYYYRLHTTYSCSHTMH